MAIVGKYCLVDTAQVHSLDVSKGGGFSCFSWGYSRGWMGPGWLPINNLTIPESKRKAQSRTARLHYKNSGLCRESFLGHPAP